MTVLEEKAVADRSELSVTDYPILVRRLTQDKGKRSIMQISHGVKNVKKSIED